MPDLEGRLAAVSEASEVSAEAASARDRRWLQDRIADLTSNLTADVVSEAAASRRYVSMHLPCGGCRLFLQLDSCALLFTAAAT